MKTKIIATLGPACEAIDTMVNMIHAGVDVFRINLSHQGPEEWRSRVINARLAGKRSGRMPALLFDLQGPKIRTGETSSSGVVLHTGNTIILTSSFSKCNEGLVFVNYKGLVSDTRCGERILIDDGKIALQITGTEGPDRLVVKVLSGGLLTSRKGVNFPETRLNVPALTDADKENIKLAIELEIDWLALSFVRSPKDIEEVRALLQLAGSMNQPGIIAKIEKPEAVDTFSEILNVADAIMIARGDLGVEVPFERLPIIQKDIIRQCISAAKPVIVATQMLEGMMNSLQPTRAEINDIANSVLDGADTLMLSGETATGLHPIESVETMQRVINRIELSGEVNQNRRDALPGTTERFITDTLIQNATQLATETSAKAITAYTHTGYTAFRLAAHRPKARIFIFTDNPWLPSRLKLLWGVEALFLPKPSKTVDYTEMMRQALTRNRWLDKGDVVIHLASFPLSAKGKTNMLYLASV
ncbi:MAG TPA: pyruvate kinase [Bacteroidales bacterium]|nr:MAG: pyruvate kinase [Bacteroidetes bacterium GWE2_42_24]OFY27564.1 MAG: pyruvate kinase [Bacteroidetes bacterium GWF2_43_11]HAQ64956.1 pyruvate kinase [Bacteroidales bacterium]HBZ66088.1 pyruvate kinase [Bacteroidales bacterium]